MDRGGLVGADGATHCGAFDVTYMACLPNMVVMAPSNEAELIHMVATAAAIDDRCAGVVARRAGCGGGGTGWRAGWLGVQPPGKCGGACGGQLPRRFPMRMQRVQGRSGCWRCACRSAPWCEMGGNGMCGAASLSALLPVSAPKQPPTSNTPHAPHQHSHPWGHMHTPIIPYTHTLPARTNPTALCLASQAFVLPIPAWQRRWHRPGSRGHHPGLQGRAPGGALVVWVLLWHVPRCFLGGGRGVGARVRRGALGPGARPGKQCEQCSRCLCQQLGDCHLT